MDETPSYLEPPFTSRENVQFGKPMPMDTSSIMLTDLTQPISGGYMMWFRPIVAQVTSGLVNVDTNTESKAMAIITDFVSNWKRRCIVEMRSQPKLKRRYQKTMAIIADLFHPSDYKGENDMNAHRKMTVKNPEAMKEVFLSICCDPSKGVKASDIKFKKITGTSDEGIPGPQMQDMITKEVRSEYDDFVQQRALGRDATMPWILNFKMFEHRLPASVLETFVNKMGGHNNKMVSELVGVMNDGRTSEDLIEEEEIKRFIAEQVPPHAVFPVRNIVRPFGARSYASNPELCKMFNPMRTALFGAVPVCEPFDANIDKKKKKSKKTDDKFTKFAFFPPVPSPELTGIQQDFVWSCIAPVMFGAMYPWFTRPSDKVKQLMTKSFHAQMILCSHGLTSAGERFITAVVPVFMYMCNMVRKFLPLTKKTAMQIRVDMNHKKPVLNGLRWIKNVPEAEDDDDGTHYWKTIQDKINQHDDGHWDPGDIVEFSQGGLFDDDIFEAYAGKEDTEKKVEKYRLLAKMFSNIEDLDLGSGVNIMEHISVFEPLLMTGANVAATGLTQTLAEIKDESPQTTLGKLLKLGGYDWMKLLTNSGPGLILHDGLKVRGEILPFQIHGIKDGVYILTWCPGDKKGVACQTKKVVDFYRTLINDRSAGNSGCSMHEHNIMRDHYDEPELYESDDLSEFDDDDETYYMHDDTAMSSFHELY